MCVGLKERESVCVSREEGERERVTDKEEKAKESDSFVSLIELPSWREILSPPSDWLLRSSFQQPITVPQMLLTSWQGWSLFSSW